VIEEEAIITRLEGDLACVQIGRDGSGCGRCHEAGGCRSGVLAQLFGSSPRQYRIPNHIGAVPGERVIVRVADGAVGRAALVAYILPVLGVVAGALAGTSLAGTPDDLDTAATLGALFGFGGAVVLGLSARKRWSVGSVQPDLLRKNFGTCIVEE
jgi:sigma-E factor negative regulatory protein RseC